MTEVTQLSDKELSEAINFHRRQRNLSRGVNESAHMRQTQMVRMLEAEEARRLEEAQQIDELQKSTLGSYIKKANLSAMDQARKSGEYNNPDQPKHFSKAMDRMRGIKKATDKLVAKEEVEELDELKKSTLGSYMKKASGNMAGNAAVAAAQASSSMGKSSPETKRNITNRMKGIARATDKLTKEEVALDEAKSDMYHKHMLKALGKTRLPKDHAYTSSIANNGDFVVRDGGGRTVGRIAKDDHNLNEVSDKKLDAYRQKAFADQPSGDDGSDKYRKRKFGRDLAFAKQTGRAKVLATKEEVELDELNKSTLGSYIKRAAGERGHAGIEAGASASGSKDQKDAMSTMKKRLKGIKMASDRLAKEEVEINEAKLSPEKQERLDSLISNVIMTTDPSYYGNDTPQKYLKAIEKEFGAAIAKQVDDGSYKTHWGRDNHSSGHDKLASRQWSSKFKGGPRVTAAGKMNKQDVSALKNRIKGDKKFGGLLKSVKLPEEIELDEAVDE